MKSLAHSCSSWWQSGLKFHIPLSWPSILCYLIFVSLLLLLSQIQTILPFPSILFFPSVCFVIVKIPSWCDFYLVSPSSQKSRAINPPLDHHLLSHLLPRQLLDLAFTLHPHKHSPYHFLLQYYSSLQVVVTASLFPIFCFSVAKLPVARTSIFLLHFPVYLAVGKDHVIKFGQWEVRRVMWQSESS